MQLHNSFLFLEKISTIIKAIIEKERFMGTVRDVVIELEEPSLSLITIIFIFCPNVEINSPLLIFQIDTE